MLVLWHRCSLPPFLLVLQRHGKILWAIQPSTDKRSSKMSLLLNLEPGVMDGGIELWWRHPNTVILYIRLICKRSTLKMLKKTQRFVKIQKIFNFLLIEFSYEELYMLSSWSCRQISQTHRKIYGPGETRAHDHAFHGNLLYHWATATYSFSFYSYYIRLYGCQRFIIAIRAWDIYYHVNKQYGGDRTLSYKEVPLWLRTPSSILPYL